MIFANAFAEAKDVLPGNCRCLMVPFRMGEEDFGFRMLESGWGGRVTVRGLRRGEDS